MDEGSTYTHCDDRNLYSFAAEDGRRAGKPYDGSLNYAFDEVCKYWIKTNHVYSSNVIIMDREYFDALPEDIQQAVQEAAEYAGVTVSEQQLQKEKEAEQELIDKGCHIVEVDTDQFIEYFKDFTDEKFPYLADWAEKIQRCRHRGVNTKENH